jgi:hypothetical protein
MVTGEPEEDFLIFPGDDVTTYPKIVEPPLFVGAVNTITASLFPGVADGDVGASGTDILESKVVIFDVSAIP